MARIIKELKTFTIPIIAVIVLVFIQSLSELALPTMMSDIVDTGIVKGDVPYILKIGLWMILVAAIGTLSAILASFVSSKVSSGFGKQLRYGIFFRVEGFSLSEFDQIGTASLVTRTTNDITQIQNFTVTALRMLIRAPVMAIGGIIMAVSKDAKLSLLLIGVVALLSVLIFFVSRKTMPLFKSLQKKVDRINLVLRDYLTGIRVVRAFNRTKREKERFHEANLDLTGTAIKVNKIMALLMPLMMLLFNFTSILIFWFGSVRVDNGAMQVGDLMAYIQYAMQIMFSLVMMTMMFIMVPRASVSAARISEVMDMKTSISDPQLSKKVDARGFIEFKNVSFCFEGAAEPVIKNVSFSSWPGKVTAVIGSTGSGKTTLMNLIMRFYDVTEGKILVDGVDVKEINQKVLREKIGFVPQNAVLFTGTIADNIRFGNESITGDMLKKAAEVAQANEFIDHMKDGYDSEISQGGTNVSGGQKQRLSIARALAKKPEIYIFDDCFSALDFKTEAKLRNALKEYTRQDSLIIVAQRVNTVMDADQIIVLENGAVAGIGNHKALMKNCEVYREIVSSQLSEEEIA